MALCDHDSTDDSHLLPELFAQRGIGGVVLDRAPKPRQTEFNNSIDEQLACMDQCFERYRDDTDWFIIAVSRASVRPLPDRSLTFNLLPPSTSAPGGTHAAWQVCCGP